MKINVNGYEVEITAKLNGDNDDATLFFLNDLSIAFQNSCIYNTTTGFDALANRDKKTSAELFDICHKAGLYEG